MDFSTALQTKALMMAILLNLGMVCELGKKGFIFSFIPTACAVRMGCLLPRLLPLLSFICPLTVSTCGKKKNNENLNFGCHCLTIEV